MDHLRVDIQADGCRGVGSRSRDRQKLRFASDFAKSAVTANPTLSMLAVIGPSFRSMAMVAASTNFAWPFADSGARLNDRNWIRNGPNALPTGVILPRSASAAPSAAASPAACGNPRDEGAAQRRRRWRRLGLLQTFPLPPSRKNPALRRHAQSEIEGDRLFARKDLRQEAVAGLVQIQYQLAFASQHLDAGDLRRQFQFNCGLAELKVGAIFLAEAIKRLLLAAALERHLAAGVAAGAGPGDAALEEMVQVDEEVRRRRSGPPRNCSRQSLLSGTSNEAPPEKEIKSPGPPSMRGTKSSVIVVCFSLAFRTGLGVTSVQSDESKALVQILRRQGACLNRARGPSRKSARSRHSTGRRRPPAGLISFWRRRTE